MSIEDIAAKGPAPYGKHDPVMLDNLVLAIDRLLLVHHKTMGTTQLIRLLLSQPGDAQKKTLIAWVRLARIEGKLEGCYTAGKPTAGTFGKPRIHWTLTADKRAEIENYIAMGEPE